MDKKLIGAFRTEQSAIQAINRLKMDGFANDEISVIGKERASLERIEDLTDVNIDNNNATGAVTGAVAGGALGGVGALLLEFGVLAIPGVGTFLAAGPIAATLVGIVAGGAVGGVSGALIEYGLSETDAKEYESYLDQGNILVLVDERDNKDLVYDNFYENESINRDSYLGDGYTRKNYNRDGYTRDTFDKNRL